jgi:hypothetical protein
LEVVRITEESPELNRIRKGYKEDLRVLQERRDFIDAEVRRLGALYEECRDLWMQGDFKRLSEALGKEGFRFLRELSEKLVRLDGEAKNVRTRLEGINRDLKEGIVCPRCSGMGNIVIEKRFERSEGQITPIVKTQKCPLCKGLGKLRLN